MTWTLGKKLALGFSTLIMIIIVLTTVVFLKINNVNRLQTTVLELRQPSAAHAQNIREGVNKALAGLRGFMATGKVKFKAERTAGWDIINSNLDELTKLSNSWDQENVNILQDLKSILVEFDVAQKSVEDISHTPENKPALVILFKEAAPRAVTMLKALTDMIDAEKGFEATVARKALLANLADSRGSLATGLAAIRAYLLSGESRFADTFHEKWKINTARLQVLQQTREDLLTKGQAEDFATYEQARREFVSLPDKMFKIQQSDGANIANKLLVQEAAPRGAKSNKLLAQLIENQTALARNDVSSLKQESKTLLTVILVIASVSVILGILIALWNIRSVTKPINKIIKELTEGSEQVSSASSQVSSASQLLAEGSTEQAASLEETSSSLEEMSSMTKQNADNAQQANTLASEARKAADNGSEAMVRMSTAINDIQKSSDETAKIIKVIDEIAFQTNLLALNAAVEAARAGEAGKGFAVVAEEVRNLAMRSADAAKNTANMIEESVKNSKNGVDIANEVGKVLEEIVQGIGKTTDLVGEIAAASAEQAQGIDQVNTAVAQMDKVTQQNAANAEESASASQELNNQAKSMNTVIADLVKLVGSHTSERHQSRNNNSGSRIVNRNDRLSKSDNVFHNIASNPQQKNKVTAPSASLRTSVTAAKNTIPLDDDNNFDEFNS